MKFSDLNGKLLCVVSASPWEILLEEENDGMPGGKKFMLRPNGSDDQFGGHIELFLLKEERAKP